MYKVMKNSKQQFNQYSTIYRERESHPFDTHLFDKIEQKKILTKIFIDKLENTFCL